LIFVYILTIIGILQTSEQYFLWSAVSEKVHSIIENASSLALAIARAFLESIGKLFDAHELLSHSCSFVRASSPQAFHFLVDIGSVSVF
jgi:hypothetical protein